MNRPGREPPPRRRSGEQSFSSVGRGDALRGRIAGAGLLVLHGRLEGGGEWDGDLLVAPGGRLVASLGLRARRLRLEGHGEGAIEVGELLEVTQGSRLLGEVRAAEARIEPGARPTARLRLGAPGATRAPR